MKKLSIYLFATTILWSHQAFNMEEKIDEKISEKNIEYPQIKPDRFLDVKSENEHASVKINERDNTALVLDTNKDKSITIKRYDLISGKLLNSFTTDEYKYFDNSVYSKSGNVIFLLKKDSVLIGKQPIFMYNIEKETLTLLKYTLEDGDDITYPTSSLHSDINVENYHYKVATLSTSNKKQKYIFFDEKNNVISTMLDENSCYDACMSPSGDALLTNIIENRKRVWNLYDIADKTKPSLLKTIVSEACWWSQIENIFCDRKNIYNTKGDLLKQLTHGDREYVIGFSKNGDSFVTKTSYTKPTILRSTTHKDHELVQEWEDGIDDSVCFIDNKENGPEIVFWDPIQHYNKQIVLYKNLKKQALENNNNSGYFSKCVIN